jgi:hypothetical protein
MFVGRPFNTRNIATPRRRILPGRKIPHETPTCDPYEHILMRCCPVEEKKADFRLV